MPGLPQSLTTFSNWALGQCKGDEKSDAQTFLNRFFQALGHADVAAAGAFFEYRIAKKPGSLHMELQTGPPPSGKRASGGKKFADLLWPGRVLIEMKSRGERLERHYDQLFEYWTHIVPSRPPYAILCNFDEFWIYDFRIQLFDPVDRIYTRDLARRQSALGFLLPEPQDPLFENNRIEVTRQAANRLAEVYWKVLGRSANPHDDRPRAQRFMLQLVVALVAEDLGLLPKNNVRGAIRDCLEKDLSSYDVLGQLFWQMNTPEPARAGRFKGVPYFNGGLFATCDPLEFSREELADLAEPAVQDWSKVKAEVFGALLQAVLDEKVGQTNLRHARGVHFTSEQDIQKIVLPTIVRPFRKKIEAADRIADKRERRGARLAVLAELRAFRVLDPACGSGNFLAVAYREMKRLEFDLLNRLAAEMPAPKKANGSRAPAKKQPPPEALTATVSLQQFCGIDVLPFAAELAKVTLLMAKELWIKECEEASEDLLTHESPLPLDNLDANIVCADALFTPWPECEAIIGNPPYLDARKMTMEFGVDYVARVRSAFPEVPGRADLVVYFFRKAHDHLKPGQRCGLVGTNTIRQNYSREGGLDHVVRDGTITDAISTQVWSGDAAVHVSIVNWIKGAEPGPYHLSFQTGDNLDSPWRHEDLPAINAALSLELDVTSAQTLQANANSTGCYEGQQPGHDGFRLNKEERKDLLRKEPKSGGIIFPYLNGREFLTAAWRTAPRYIIDFGEADVFTANAHPVVLQWIRERVLPDWRENAAAESARSGRANGEHQNRLETWWQLKRRRSALLGQIAKSARYIVCSRVTKRPIFDFVSSSVRPDSSLTVFPLPDDYSFGILQSGIHFAWFKARCSSLKGDYRYTSDTVFDTFPWPQKPTKKQLRAVADAAVALRKLRHDVMREHDWSLRDLYRTLDDPGANPLADAHVALDTAVRAAYGMKASEDPLAHLLALNQACAAEEKNGESVTPPGLPLPPSQHASFITEDCIRVGDISP